MARSMAPLYDGNNYYKRMFELQEKLRKSEEERIRLEERFNVLVRESHNRHNSCINQLRMRYIQYLEEQRMRDERNHKLLAVLDKVMNKLALISAKKDRLNVLRKQYEAHLLRVYANRQQPGSVTGDSGIVSQNEDKYTRKIVTVTQPDVAETRDVLSPRAHLSARSNQPKSTSTSKLHDQIAVNGASLNHSPILPTTSLAAPLGVDHQTYVLREPHVSPIGQSSEQFAQVSAISSPNARQYPRTIFGHDGTLQDVQDGKFRISHTKTPVLQTTFSDQIQPDAVPVNRFFKEHVESVQASSGLSPRAQFPAGDAVRYEEPVPRRFDPLTVLQYHDPNILLSRPQSRIREYNPSDFAEPSLMTAKSSTYRVDPNISVVNQVGPLPGYMDYTPHKSEDEGSIRSLTSDDVDDLIRRNEHLFLKSADGAKIQRSPIDVSGLYNLDENGRTRTTAILENELDRYINKIRKIHREHGVTSLEELDHEQNTSGDVLNVSLSEDAVELPVENRVRMERMSEEMDRILALASDLASRTPGLKEVTRDTAGQSDNLPAEVAGNEIKHREATTDDTLQLEGKCEAEGRGISARNEIREDVATHSTELEQTRRNAEIAKESWNNADDSAESRERKLSVVKKDDTHETTTSLANESQINDEKNASKKKQFDLVTGKESNIEGLFDVAEELAPWNLASVQKEVLELHLDDSDGDRAVKKDAEETENRTVDEIANESPFTEQSGADDKVENVHLPQDTLPQAEMESKKMDVNESHETHPPIKDAENMSYQMSNQHEAGEPAIAFQANEELGESRENNENQDHDKTTSNQEPQSDDRSQNMMKDNEYSPEQVYVEDPSQERQYEQDPNQQYYEQSMAYEGGNISNEEYASYATQGFAQEGQEYVEYVDNQYEQYPEDPNNPQYQHDPNAQYEQDPNQAYDYNYDPNQGYGDDPNQQYDPNQGYGDSSGNQAYEYTEQVPYGPNQVYDNMYEQEYKEEQNNPDDNVVENRGEPETEETSQRQGDPESEHKSGRDEDESQQAEAVNGTKKKKDVIKSLLDSDTDTTIERNVSNTESDFDFN
ncbi:LOW QUALITY PROTEIN: uncharacterized protein LOC114930511 [Nylanderia fulva]|uniref:LOW QUALITY PROTEIN: uncharacterized protein LOC114930511 n=1 Tax=Nylanderia fulva TaxID=613905 RepID=UPI0010FB327C|nr:LOW QUALITY PROTEIN: uncharacterized protein LOC114930511 [Nylanderia fulva]